MLRAAAGGETEPKKGEGDERNVVGLECAVKCASTAGQGRPKASEVRSRGPTFQQ